MSIPCLNDDRFISDNPATQRQAAALCFDCPAFDLCYELRGEEAGVRAGMVASDAERVEVRKRYRLENKLGYFCPNGHGPEHYNVDLNSVSMSHYTMTGCRECSRLGRAIERVGETEGVAA